MIRTMDTLFPLEQSSLSTFGPSELSLYSRLNLRLTLLLCSTAESPKTQNTSQTQLNSTQRGIYQTPHTPRLSIREI